MKTTLLITFGKTERNMVFICCCFRRSACITCSWLPCSFFFYVKRRERLCVYLAWLAAFGNPSFSELRFFVSLKFSITFFPMPSAVSLSSCLVEESASANHPERFHFPFSSSLIFFVNFFLKSIHLSLTALLSLSWNFGESCTFDFGFLLQFSIVRCRRLTHNTKVRMSRSQETILIFLFKHYIIYLKLLETYDPELYLQ